MGWKARTIVQGALGCGLVLAGVGAAVVWRQASLDSSRSASTHPLPSAESSAAHITRAELEAVNAEITRLKERRSAWEELATTTQRELMTLRSQLPHADQREASRTRTRATRRGTEQRVVASRERPTGPGQHEAVNAQTLTPEEEIKQADEHIEVQVELIETTLLAEQPDPEWTTTAEQALHEVFQSEELAGLHLKEAACRTTLCRLELILDNTMAPEESLRTLAQLAPWRGQGFVRIDQGGSGEVLFYLAREGYTLPQLEAQR